MRCCLDLNEPGLYKASPVLPKTPVLRTFTKLAEELLIRHTDVHACLTPLPRLGCGEHANRLQPGQNLEIAFSACQTPYRDPLADL